MYKMQYYILEKIAFNQKKIDHIHKSLLHIYCMLLLIVSLIIFQQLFS